MSLRARLLTLFAALALLPLLVVAGFEMLRSGAVVRELVRTQTGEIAHRIAATANDRLQVAMGDLQLLADNAETSKLFLDSAHVDRRYLADAWQVVGRWADWATVRDRRRVELFRLGSAGSDAVSPRLQGNRRILVEIPIRAFPSGAPLGTLAAAVRLDSIAPRDVLDARFGVGGYTILIAAAGGATLYDPRDDGVDRGRAALDRLDVAIRDGSVSYLERDSARVASVASIPSRPDVLVLSSAAVNEFAGPFESFRALNIALVLALGAAAAAAFALLSRRATKPLATLTEAADEIGRGNFSPTLPSAESDDVGRLSAAVEGMARRVRAMMDELESNRHAAAIGAFASQVAHEIRNPLTAIKLNLQSLQRDARDGIIPADSRRTVEICLEQIDRLDRVVRGVLRLGKTNTGARRRVALGALVDDVTELVRPQLLAHGIVASRLSRAASDAVFAEPEQISAAVLNLFMNAIDAMPAGGSIGVGIERTRHGTCDVVRVIVADTGPGIPHEHQARIFDPFFSTKPNGTGLGLALAARSAEEHGGRLELVASDPSATGCTFALELPAAAD